MVHKTREKNFNLYRFFSVSVLCMFLLLVISACGGDADSSGKGISEKDHKKGFNGLDVWLDQSSTSNAFVGDEFIFAVHIHNIASYDVTNGKVSIQRLDRGFFTLNEPSKRFPEQASSLGGISVTDTSGEQTLVEFTGTIDRIKTGVPVHKANYDIITDYDITNQFLDTVCLPVRGYNVYDGGCTPSDGPIQFSGQGSPVSVKSVEISPSGSTTPVVRFMFKIGNSGNGVPGEIRLVKSSIGTSPLTCVFVETNTNRFTFDEGKDTEILCEGEVMSESSYKTPLNLEYFYSYTQTETGQISVKPRGGIPNS